MGRINRKKLSKLKLRFLSFFLKPNTSPVIILGNQKSGTSAIAHLLADYGNLTKTVDIPQIWSPTLEKIFQNKQSLKTFASRYSYYFSKAVIKEPALTFMFNDLVEIHPDAKFVFLVRHPVGNIRSLLNRLSIPGDLNADAAQLTIDPLWKNIFNNTLIKSEGGNYIEVLAHRWNKSAAQYFENSDSMVLVKYEDFNTSKYETIEHLADYLNIPRVNDITSKLNIQYQPKGTVKVSELDFFGEQNLNIIKTICKKYMIALDYK